MSGSKKVAFHTLGCKLNFSETSTLAREFELGGYERAERGDVVDIHVINSCSVTDTADKKCRYLIRKIAKNSPNSIIAVTGCYAQLKSEEVAAIDGVDLVIGNNKKDEIVKLCMNLTTKGKSSIFSCETERLTSFFSAFSSGDRTRTFLKVQDGCNYNCTYCTIPLARGKSRNISIEELVAQANEIASKGIKEIVLTGVNIGDFGRTTSESFLSLVEALDRVEGIERYRISSIEPNLLTSEIIDFCATSAKFQPHFHIPLQSGSDKILKLMHRRYNTSKFREKIEKVKQKIPNVFLGIDVIVGFPGETDDDFAECYNLLSELEPAYLHVFPYSERANTPAILMEGKVSTQQKEQRVKKLSELSAKLHSRFIQSQVGRRAKVLIESSQKGGLMYGHTENYIKTELPYNRELIGQIVDVQLESSDKGDVAKGELIKNIS
ncbi:MAG: tRNA (N(6)-L-threonylcarbamoyladenosine(37)-C(2))-methylthiotransferase MtaB [Rikenellaceae bacterium]